MLIGKQLRHPLSPVLNGFIISKPTYSAPVDDKLVNAPCSICVIAFLERSLGKDVHKCF
jgi:hypothetical protein